MTDHREPSPFTDTLSAEAALDLIDRGIPISEILRTYPSADTETREMLALIESLARERGSVVPPRELLKSIIGTFPVPVADGWLPSRFQKFRLPLYIGAPIVAFAALALILEGSLTMPTPTSAPSQDLGTIEKDSGARVPALSQTAPIDRPLEKSAAALSIANPIDAAAGGAVAAADEETIRSGTERSLELVELDADTAAWNDFRGISATVDTSSSSMTAAEFCADLSTTSAAFSSRIAELSKTATVRFDARSANVPGARTRADADRTSARAAADGVWLGSLDRLIQEAPTTGERSALQTFRNSIAQALRTNRNAVDEAKQTLRFAFDDAFTAREAKYRTARTTLSNAVTAAFAAAKKSCAQNPKSVTARNTAHAALIAAENKFFTSAETGVGPSLAAAIQSNDDALRTANERIEAEVGAAQQQFRASLQ